jgi:integral membrane protein (TIGR00529 family)
MLLDVVFLVIGARIPINKALTYSLNGLISDKTLKLIFILFIIMMIENTMRTTGMIRKAVENLKELVGSNRLSAAMLPSMLGLLPSPGGARFSCPMVEESLGENSDGETKAYVNYWFRHIWLDGFILYPGVILAAELLNASVLTMFLYILPFMIITAIVGAVTGVMHINRVIIKRTRSVSEALINFLKGLLPVLILIGIYIIFLYVPVPFLRSYSLEISSTIVVIGLFIYKRYTLARIVETAKQAFPVKLVIIVIGVMIFKEVLLESGIMNGLPDTIAKYGISPVALFLILPFIGAVTSGITVSYVSMTFPILITLGLGTNLWYAAMAYVAGSIGNAITPLHLCAVMSADFFKVPLNRLLVRVAKAEIVLAIVVIIMAVVFW